MLTNFPPPEVYCPEFGTWFPVVKEVVAEFRVAGLSSTVSTTYLSLQFPNGLLYACLVEAYGFLKGPNDLLQLYEGKYKQAVEGFSIEQMGRRRRDEYQSGVPRVGK